MSKFTVKQVQFIQSIMNLEPISLSTTVGDENEGSEIADFIVSIEPSPEDLAILADNRRHIDAFLELLDPRGSVCVSKYYGLFDGAPRTLEQIGREYGVTRERVRQIISKAIRKLAFKMKKSGMNASDFSW